MTITTNCENCGASMRINEDKPIMFCPYCGYALKLPENIVDLAKFQMKHNEEVRQRIVQEKISNNKRIAKRAVLIVIASVLAMVAVFYVLIAVDEDHKIDRLSNEVQQLILKGEYEEASIKVEGVRVEKKGLFDEHFNKYESLRNDLKRLIEQKKRESK